MSNYGDAPQNYGNSGSQPGGGQYGAPGNNGPYDGGGYGAQPPTNGPGYGGPVASGGGPTQGSKGFFGALFDFSFNYFVTPMIVKVVYVLATIGLILGWLIFTISGFAHSAGLGIVFLIVGAIGVLIYLALVRMTLEFYICIVRMSEDIHHRLK